MKKMFEMPTVNVERFDVTDVVTLSGFPVYGDVSDRKTAFETFTAKLGGDDTRLG